jgi:hypothetical protein
MFVSLEDFLQTRLFQTSMSSSRCLGRCAVFSKGKDSARLAVVRIFRIRNSLTPAPLVALWPGIEHQSNEADFTLGPNLVPAGGGPDSARSRILYR